MDESKYLEHREVDFEWAIKLNRISLQLVGLWPNVKKSFREKLMGRLHVLGILLLLLFGILIPYTLPLITMHIDVMLMMQNLQIISGIVSCIIRFMIFWWKKEAVTLIVDMIANDWQNTRNVDERKIMIKWAQRARMVIIIIGSIMGTACVCVIVLPGFGIQLAPVTNTNSAKLLPLQPYNIYDVTKRPLYESTYVVQSLAVVSTSMTYSGIDTFLSLLVFHICGQLDILGTRIMKLGGLMTFDNNMKECIISHVRLLRAIDVVEDVYNIMLLAIFLNFAICFTVYGFLIMLAIEETDNASMTRLVFFICNSGNIFVHMGLYCAVGEMLVTKLIKTSAGYVSVLLAIKK